MTRSVKQWYSCDERGDASSKEKERLEVEASCSNLDIEFSDWKTFVRVDRYYYVH